MREWINLFESGEWNAEARYAEFNRLFFDGELPTIPILWKNLKNDGGQVLARTRIVNGKKVIIPETLHMVLSNRYKVAGERLDGLLLHEMVHVYWMTVGNRPTESHGVYFIAKMAEIQKKSGIKIPRKDNIEGLELADETIKTVWFAVAQKDGQWRWAAILTPKAFEAADFEKSVGRYGPYDRVIAGKAQTPAWTKLGAILTVQRAFKVFQRPPTDDINAAMADLPNVEIIYDLSKVAGDRM